VRTVGACRPGVLECKDRNPADAPDEADACLVEFLDPGHLVDLELGPAAEGLDHAEARPLGGATTRGGPR